MKKSNKRRSSTASSANTSSASSSSSSSTMTTTFTTKTPTWVDAMQTGRMRSMNESNACVVYNNRLDISNASEFHLSRVLKSYQTFERLGRDEEGIEHYRTITHVNCSSSNEFHFDLFQLLKMYIAPTATNVIKLYEDWSEIGGSTKLHTFTWYAETSCMTWTTLETRPVKEMVFKSVIKHPIDHTAELVIKDWINTNKFKHTGGKSVLREFHTAMSTTTTCACSKCSGGTPEPQSYKN